jgi:DNA-binding transcriptional regulator YhcF (GntR family)
MLIKLDARSPNPLYAQIADAIRRAVAAGEFPDGAALPSVRGLSSELRVNPATVVQAYRSLEAEGIVASRHGAGTFVLGMNAERRSRTRAAEARRLIRQLVVDAARSGVSPDEIKAALDAELNGRKR